MRKTYKLDKAGVAARMDTQGYLCPNPSNPEYLLYGKRTLGKDPKQRDMKHERHVTHHS